MTLSGATTPAQRGPGSDGKEGVLYIPQTSSITGTSPSDCLVSYPRHTLGVVLPLCNKAVDVFYSPSLLSNKQNLALNKPTRFDEREREKLRQII